LIAAAQLPDEFDFPAGLLYRVQTIRLMRQIERTVVANGTPFTSG